MMNVGLVSGVLLTVLQIHGGGILMLRKGYVNGYRIVIRNSFYEIICGKRVVSYGICGKNTTVHEIARKTILKTKN